MKLLRISYRFRHLLALLLAVIVASLLYITCSDPLLALPCHGFCPGDAQRMVLSWQVSHPIDAGMLSGLLFGAWPSHGMYALPGACSYRDYGVGYPMDFYNLVRAAAYPTFRVSRAITGGLFSAFLFLLLFRWFVRPFACPAVHPAT